MSKIFSTNLLNLRLTSQLFSILTAIFAFFPIVFEHNLIKAGIYLFAALVGIVISFFSNYLMQLINVSSKVIFFMIALFYVDVMVFSTYLDVWASQGPIAVIFPCFLICSLLMFIIPPHFNLCLTLIAIFIFVGSAFFNKPVDVLIYFVVNSLIAGLISLFFSWHIIKLRLGLEISTNMLEEERNKYVDQSITDELTQLRNRRDFMQTFQRYLSNFRSSDDYLCIAIADIDFFKYYNDHYGHPKGDDCLRAVGATLNSLRDDMGIYTARVGGEEFAALWFEKDVSHVDAVISHWAGKINGLKIPHEKSKVASFVSMSIGAYVSRCGSYQETQILYDLADKALYKAKGGGRNCAIICGDEIKEYKITPKEE
ncbi:MAG: diguanylate cyclase [Treponema sp.]|nr:diguanylate cyclase [Treponema sp.]